MKKAVYIFISFLLLLPALSNLAVVISFKINEDIIAKTLCEKKEIKENTCNGQCHLKKELKKISEIETEDSSPTSYKEKIELVFIQPEFNYTFNYFFETFITSDFYFETKTSNLNTSIFHPPIV